MFGKDIIPEISISFTLSGIDNADFDIDEITKRIKIQPTKARKKHEFPQVSIDAEIACDYWSFEIREACDDISFPSKKLYNKLFDKTDIIKKLCIEQNLEVHFEVVMHLSCGTNPLNEIPREVMSFISSFNAGLGFDLYCYNENNTLDLKSLDEILEKNN